MRLKLIRVAAVLAIVLPGLFSCTKDPLPGDLPTTPRVQMEYFDLNNREIKANAPWFAIDVDHDGRNDLSFTTMLVGDPLNQVDKLKFLVLSNIGVYLPVNGSEEIPVMHPGELIVPENFNGYQWFELSSIMLVQKIISLTMPPVWGGHWINASDKYLPYQVMRNNKKYNGWVRLSVDVLHEKIVLHQAAISKESGKIVKAGE